MAFVTDNFTAANGTQLTAHTSAEDGSTWSGLTGNFAGCVIDSNRLHSNGGAGVVAISSESPAGADCDVEGVFFFFDTSTNARLGILIRVQDSDDFYYLRYDVGTGWQLMSVVGGTFTSLGTWSETPGNGTSRTAKIEARGTTLKVYIDSGSGYVERISVTNSAITAAGGVGVHPRSTAGVGAGQHLDSFSASDPGGGTPTYTGALDAASASATADLAGTYAPPEYTGALGATSGAGSAAFAGTYDAPGYSGDLTATSGASSGAFAGTYAVPEYAGDFAADSAVASVSFSGTYTAPGAAGSLSAASQPAAASFAGTYALPTYAGALGAEAGAASTSFSGTYEPPPGGVLQAVSGAATAAFSGTYAVPVYDGDFVASAGVAEAAFAGSYAVPVYVGALVALSGPATARFTEDPPIVAGYLTGTLTVRPALTGSLAVSPALSGTLSLEPV